MKKLFAAAILSVISIGLKAQYDIKLKVSELTEQKVQLAYYFEDKHYVVDEQLSDKNGNVRFTGEKSLPHGIYIIAFSETPGFFDVLIIEEQNFTLKTKRDNLIPDMQVSGSEENKIFYAHQSKMAVLRKELMLKDSLLEESSADDSLQLIRERDKLLGLLKSVEDEQIKNYPNSFLTKLLQTTRAPENEPDIWKEIDLSESGLIRTPFFVNIVRTHIALHIDKSSDYINFENDRLLRKAEANKEMHEYIAFYLLNFYRTHYKTGMNKVFVHLADNYFLNGKRDDLDPKTEKIIKDQRDLFRASYPGETAKNIRMANTAGDSVNLYDIKSDFTLIYFWSSGCGHCKKSTARLKDVYEELQKNNITVFAVNTNESFVKMLETYLEKNPVPWNVYHDTESNSRYKEYFYVVSAPMMYVLDKNKVILEELIGEEEIKSYTDKFIKK